MDSDSNNDVKDEFNGGDGESKLDCDDNMDSGGGNINNSGNKSDTDNDSGVDNSFDDDTNVGDGKIKIDYADDTYSRGGNHSTDDGGVDGDSGVDTNGSNGSS